ncbi:PAS domain S-box-containing protein [Maridesulfovibrio ferrireducens]|uniref:Sensor protein FixL n=1 Tax=Maridesulfovibrio ferrireducens TaxID=246191 RepID=A0A1G9EV75_9BACT|nr:PAS domain S-box protein [Maridesulfovibrio ferrireducens]SDK80066.1 PAS domain S-box-containing protein [Maridesulfovibrio ferrireducens]
MSEGQENLIIELRSIIGRLEAVLSSIDEALLWTDEDGKAKWCNDSFAKLIGLKRIFIMGKSVTDIFHLCLRGQMLPNEAHPLYLALSHKNSQQGDFTFGPSDIPLFIKVQYLDMKESPPSTIMLVRDSSQEKELEEFRLQGAALAAAADAIVILDINGRVHWINKAFTRMTGYKFDEIYGKTLSLIKSGMQSKDFYHNLWETILSGSSWSGELVNRRKSGEFYHEYQTVTPVTNSKGKVTNFIAIKNDITEKKLAQKALENREAKLSALFNGIIDAIVTADSAGKIETVNPAAEKIFGYDPGELTGKNVRILVPPELRPDHDSYIKRYLDTRIPRIIGIGQEREAVRKDGSRFPIELSITEIVTDDATMFTGIVRDISERKRQEKELSLLNEKLEQRVQERTIDLENKTLELMEEVAERKRAEMQIRQSSELLLSLLDGISAAFIILNLEKRTIVEINGVAENMFGISRNKILNKNCDQIFKAQGSSLETVCPDSIEGETLSETYIINATGATLPVSRHVLPITVKERPHLALILFDITARKNLERKLVRAQKLESIGRLAAGIAHEINTPIQYIGDSVQFIKEAFDDFLKLSEIEGKILDSCRELEGFEEIMNKRDKVAEDEDTDFIMNEIPEACTRALEGVGRVATIVKAMKNFSHPGESSKQLTDINKAITTTLAVARNEWKYAAEVDLQFEDIPMIMTLQGDINQVLLNMIVNAAHAIRDKQEITGKKGEITIVTTKKDDFITIEITDNGAGIPPEVLDNIFDPFFTTKKVGEGTGQGLAIVHDIIVSKHGGSIDVDSKLGVGTTFIIHLPLTATT